MNPTLPDIVDFIKKYRGNTPACRGWSELQIAHEIVTALDKGCVCIDQNGVTNEIYGIVICYPKMDEHILHIKALIINREIPGVVKRMLDKFYSEYPGYLIQAYRKENLVKYGNTYRLCKLLEILSL
jgi:hypothetical protein